MQKLARSEKYIKPVIVFSRLAGRSLQNRRARLVANKLFIGLGIVIGSYNFPGSRP